MKLPYSRRRHQWSARQILLEQLPISWKQLQPLCFADFKRQTCHLTSPLEFLIFSKGKDFISLSKTVEREVDIYRVSVEVPYFLSYGEVRGRKSKITRSVTPSASHRFENQRCQPPSEFSASQCMILIGREPLTLTWQGDCHYSYRYKLYNFFNTSFYPLSYYLCPS